MSFDTSFIESTSSKALVDATLAALAEGRFTTVDEFTTAVILPMDGLVEVELGGRNAGIFGVAESRPVSFTDGDFDSPFHGTREQRVALFDHVRSLVG